MEYVNKSIGEVKGESLNTAVMYGNDNEAVYIEEPNIDALVEELLIIIQGLL